MSIFSSGQKTPAAADAPGSAWGQFWLVVIMLSILFLLTLALIVIPFWYASKHAETAEIVAPIVDYCKWALAVLLGAFGAWIGAGAAYFFGKENLAESSRSTAEALRIQLAALRPKVHQIRELSLTTLNTEFVFGGSIVKTDVLKKLDNYRGYWWVPVLEGDHVKDVIHARVFWTTGADTDTIDNISSKLDTDPALSSLKQLHGPSFFTRVTLDDNTSETLALMDKNGAVVGIVEDERGKATYCFTKQDLVTAQKTWEGATHV